MRATVLEKDPDLRHADRMNEESCKPVADRVALAQRLFDEFYARCFWHMPPGFSVRPVDIATIVKGLRTYGGRRGFIAAASLCHSVISKPPSSRRSRKTAA